MVTQVSSDFIPGGAGGSIFPTFKIKKDVPFFNNWRNVNYGEGYIGNGDYIALPTAFNSTNIEYYNNSGVLQFGISFANLDTAFSLGAGTIDIWCGFMFDSIDALVYGMAADTAGSPATYYLFGVDSAGVITTIGSGATPTTDVGLSPAQWGSGNGGYLQRAQDGSGNFFIRNTSKEIEFNETTGVVVTDATDTGTEGARSYKTANGLYIGAFVLESLSGARSVMRIDMNASSSTQYQVNIGIPIPDIGLGASSATLPSYTQWKGYVGLFGNSGLMEAGGRFLETSNLDKGMEIIANNIGITV